MDIANVHTHGHKIIFDDIHVNIHDPLPIT